MVKLVGIEKVGEALHIEVEVAGRTYTIVAMKFFIATEDNEGCTYEVSLSQFLKKLWKERDGRG